MWVVSVEVSSLSREFYSILRRSKLILTLDLVLWFALLTADINLIDEAACIPTYHYSVGT